MKNKILVQRSSNTLPEAWYSWLLINSQESFTLNLLLVTLSALFFRETLNNFVVVCLPVRPLILSGIRNLIWSSMVRSIKISKRELNFTWWILTPCSLGPFSWSNFIHARRQTMLKWYAHIFGLTLVLCWAQSVAKLYINPTVQFNAKVLTNEKQICIIKYRFKF